MSAPPVKRSQQGGNSLRMGQAVADGDRVLVGRDSPLGPNFAFPVRPIAYGLP